MELTDKQIQSYLNIVERNRKRMSVAYAKKRAQKIEEGTLRPVGRPRLTAEEIERREAEKATKRRGRPQKNPTETEEEKRERINARRRFLRNARKEQTI